MDPITTITTIIGSGVAIIGLFGWSHSSLRTRMDKLEMKINTKPSDEELRLIIKDKLAPHRIEYSSLSKRMDEIYHENEKLNSKIDQLIRLCVRISNDNKG